MRALTAIALLFALAEIDKKEEQGEVALSAGRAPRPDETATVPEVNNNEAEADDEEEDAQPGDAQLGDVQLGDPKSTTSDIYDYRKARVTQGAV
jgi:hypothetical protein